MCDAKRFVTGVSAESADITIVAGAEEQQWQVEYKLASDSDWTFFANVENLAFIIDNLSENNNYDFRVRSVCSDENFSNWQYSSFKTTCLPIFELPYFEDFESYTESYSLPDCWNRNSIYSANYPAVTSQGYNSARSLYFYASDNAYVSTVLNAIEGYDINQLEISFMLRQNNTYPYLAVGVMTNPNDISTFVSVDTVFVTESSVSTPHWELKTVLLSNYQGEGKHIAFKYQGMSSAYLDSLTIKVHEEIIEPDTCETPVMLTVDNITETSAHMSWQQNNDEISSWTIQYRIENAEFISENAENNEFQLENLQENTTYEVKVRANCNDELSSEWAETISFTTLQTIIIEPDTCETPVMLTVDNISETSAHISWQQNSNDISSWTIQYRIENAEFTSENVENSEFQLENLQENTTYEVTVRANCNDELSSEWTETVTFTTLQTIIIEPDTCETPYNLIVDSFDKVSVTLSWESNDEPLNWIIFISEDGNQWQDSVTSTSKSVTISNLETGKTYYFKVMAVCEEAIMSEYSNIVSATPSSIKDYDKMITIYPNPAKNIIKIASFDNELLIQRIEIYDVYGKKVSNFYNYSAEDDINIEEFSSGFYILQITTDKGTISKAFVKE